MKFIVCADLHLSLEEEDYSFAVLREVLSLCREERCGALLFAGDLFNSWLDVEALHAKVRALAENLPCAAYFIPGNHEELRAPKDAKLSAFDFGRIKLLSRKPFQIEVLDGETELLVLPFQKEYTGYRNWDVPAKTRPRRIVLAHGTVPGISYMGPDDEEQTGVLDADLFSFLRADLAVLGHLHGGGLFKKDGVPIAYPGSARIWREGETGPRTVFIGGASSAEPLRLEPRILTSAGEYRAVSAPLSLSGGLQMPEDFRCSAADWVQLEVSGFVEDEKPVREAAEKTRAELEKKCRRAGVSFDRLGVLAGLSSHPLALEFIKKWEAGLNGGAAEGGEGEREVYNLARIKGLAALKEILEGRK